MNFSLIKKFLIIFLILFFSVNVNAQTILKKIDLANITVDCPDEILIERGWTKYISFSVDNNGESDLYKIEVSLEGKYTVWFEFQNDKIDFIPIGSKKDFITKVSIPYDTTIGDYNFSLNIKSDELIYNKNFLVRVFGTRDDLLLYQIQGLREDLNELEGEADKTESNKVNLTFARDIMYQIKSELNQAEEQVRDKMYTQVTETIRDVEKLFIKARFEISNPPNTTEEGTKDMRISEKDILLYSSGIGIGILLISLIYLVRKIKIENKVRVPNLRLKELVVESKKMKELEEEIKKIRESQEIIDEEYKENVISKESYEELRTKYQEKLLDLEGERRKSRGY